MATAVCRRQFIMLWLAVFSSLKCFKVTIWYSKTYCSYSSIVYMLIGEWTMSRIHVSDVDWLYVATFDQARNHRHFGRVRNYCVWIAGTLGWIEKLLSCVPGSYLSVFTTQKCLVTYADYWFCGRATALVMVRLFIPIIQVGDSGDWWLCLLLNWRRMWKDHRRPVWG